MNKELFYYIEELNKKASLLRKCYNYHFVLEDFNKAEELKQEYIKKYGEFTWY